MPALEPSKYVFYKWAKYQWEFMRRSPLFEKIYQNFLKAHGGTSPYVDPSLTFDEIIKKYQNDYEGVIGMMLVMQRMLPSSVKYDFGDTTLKIEIDFEQVNSIKSLKKYISDLINIQYTISRKLNHFKDKKRRNMVEYDAILKAGDLYEEIIKKHPSSIYGKIAEILYPNDSDRRAAETKACQRVEEYKKLINGGFFDLVYP